MLFFRTVNYLKYILFSKSSKGHGIHSPFVFDLVVRVFKKNDPTNMSGAIEGLRKRHLTDDTIINVDDLGTGRSSNKPYHRRVSDIVARSPVSKRYGILLSNLASEFGGKLIIELGTSLGISTMYMASSNPNAMVYTIEGCPETSAIAVRNFKEAGLTNIKMFNGSFDVVLPDIISDCDTPGIIFIDGDHRKESLLRYYNKLADISDNNTVVIIDDIYYSREMNEAWDIIKQSEKVTLTIDLYRFGMVFFRKEGVYGHYTIKF